jgi:hypothetical protein
MERRKTLRKEDNNIRHNKKEKEEKGLSTTRDKQKRQNVIRCRKQDSLLCLCDSPCV